MNADALIARLAPFPDTLDALLAKLPEADWRWRPAEGGWSLLEVVNHLVDEEVEDFRARVRHVLFDPSGPWPALDPEGVVVSRRYQERDPGESLRRFREERAASLAWLRGLVAPDWTRSKPHPRVGSLAAGELLASWAAHDARHLQQIAKRLHGLAAKDGAPWSVAYAG
jgi:DinB family protein